MSPVTRVEMKHETVSSMTIVSVPLANCDQVAITTDRVYCAPPLSHSLLLKCRLQCSFLHLNIEIAFVFCGCVKVSEIAL